MVPRAPREGGAESRGNTAGRERGGGGCVGVAAAPRAHAQTSARPWRLGRTRGAGIAGPESRVPERSPFAPAVSRLHPVLIWRSLPSSHLTLHLVLQQPLFQCGHKIHFSRSPPSGRSGKLRCLPRYIGLAMTLLCEIIRLIESPKNHIKYISDVISWCQMGQRDVCLMK